MVVLERNILITVAMLLTLSAFTVSKAKAQRPESPEPAVNRALLEATKEIKSDSLRSFGLRLPSESRAEFWSMTGTLAPIVAGVVGFEGSTRIVLIATGVMIGPSAGYIYGGCGSRGVNGILVRTAIGTFAIVVATAVANSQKSTQWMDFSGLYEGLMIGGIGAAIIVFHAAYDLTKVKSTVKKYNEKLLNASISLKPKMFAQGNALGLELTVTF